MPPTTKYDKNTEFSYNSNFLKHHLFPEVEGQFYLTCL